MNNPLGYPPLVWELFTQTPRAGRVEGGVAAEAGTPAGGARLRLEVRVEAQGRIEDARFLAWGCPYVIATGAWLAQWLVGQPRAALAAPPLAELRTALEIPEERAHCGLMAQDVLRALHDALS